MREKPRDPSRLQHMLHAISKVEEFLEGKTRDDFTSDSLLFYGVVKNIEIIGEAAYMLTQEFRESHPLTPWRQIAGMRHFLVHGYYQVDASEVWNVAQKDLQPLRIQITEYLKELN